MDQTVSAMTPAKLAAYRKALLTRQKLTKSLAEARLQKAWGVARRGAAILKSDFGAKKVMVFGSVTQPELFHARSDVDLAVWGLAEREYFRAVGILQGLDASIGVDVVLAEDASPQLAKAIEEGQEL
ncbi:MAG: nucleotidyltransferase domain-containing protein [Chloroflexota bacterium]